MKKIKRRQNWKNWLVLLLLLAVFIGLRIFSLKNSFWFFGDLGRDMLVLQKWAANFSRPPLLGPQTSVISFNQSAWYYYYLFPFFVVTSGSVYSSLLATLTLYGGMFVGAFLAFKSRRHWRHAAALFYLIAIHPQFVLQHRYVWNPSLVTPFLLLGFWAWWRYHRRPDWSWLALFALSLSAAVGLNFSLVPTAAVMILLFIVEQWGNWRRLMLLVLFGVLANLIVHAPTLFFEIRHQFLLTRNLPTQELLQQEPLWVQKISDLFVHVFAPTQSAQTGIVAGAITLALLIFVLLRSERLRTNWLFSRSLQISGLTALIMIVAPFRIHEHYIFGVLTFLLVALARLPKQILIGFVVLASAFYLQPYYWQLYQQAAPHSVTEQTVCTQQVCQVIKDFQLEPIFVNTHSASHNHQALEYVFWLNKWGCQAIDAQTFNATPAPYMAVVADRAEFVNNETAYYELSQFGQAEELVKISCGEDLLVYLLEKAN